MDDAGAAGLGGFIGMTEHKMETTTVYWGHVGIMEKKMEASI